MAEVKPRQPSPYNQYKNASRPTEPVTSQRGRCRRRCSFGRESFVDFKEPKVHHLGVDNAHDAPLGWGVLCGGPSEDGQVERRGGGSVASCSAQGRGQFWRQIVWQPPSDAVSGKGHRVAPQQKARYSAAADERRHLAVLHVLWAVSVKKRRYMTSTVQRTAGCIYLVSRISRFYFYIEFLCRFNSS